MSFLLGVDGQNYTLEALNVTKAVLTTTNQGHDSLKLTLGQSINAETPFSPYAQVTLTDEGGSQRFIGWVDQAPADAEGARQECSIVIAGPLRWLDMCPFSQVFVDTSTAPPTITTTPVQVPIVNQSTDDNGNLIKLGIGATIQAAITAVTTQFGAVISNASGDLTAITTELPFSEKQNVSCGSVIRDQLGWIPGYAAWWDYTGATPEFRVTQITGAASQQVTATGIDPTKIRINPRFDLLAKRVTITYVTLITNQTTNQVIRATSVDDSEVMAGSDAANLSCPNIISLTFPLTKEETAPTNGLATQYAQWVSKLSLDSEIAVFDPGMCWGYLPGQLWGYSGIASPWSSYTSEAQVIERDLVTRITTVHLGSPAHLGLHQLIDLHKKNTPQAGNRGGGGGNAYAPGNITVNLAIAWGTSDDYIDATTDCYVTLIGPGGSQTLPANTNGNALVWSNLQPGNYGVFVAQESADWVLSSASQTVTLAAGGAHTVTITLTRLSSLSLNDEDGSAVILDASDGISINNGSDSDDPDGHTDLDGSGITIADTTYALTLDSSSLDITDADGSSIALDIEEGGLTFIDGEDESSLDEDALTIWDTTYSATLDSNSLLITGEEGSGVTIDIPTEHNGTTPTMASFQELEFCGSDGTLYYAKFLMTTPEAAS